MSCIAELASEASTRSATHQVSIPSNMLPDFPSLKAKRHSKLLQGCMDKSRSNHGILHRLVHIHQHEGDNAIHLDVSGDISMSGYEHTESTLELDVSQPWILDDNRWMEALRKMTDVFATEEMKLFLRKLDEATERAGNVIDAKGEPFSEKQILRAFEKVTLDFQDGGLSPELCFLMGPEMAKRFQELELSDDFRKEFSQIIDLKRAEWRIREADRKLVD